VTIVAEALLLLSDQQLPVRSMSVAMLHAPPMSARIHMRDERSRSAVATF
jgi:hypothetical protein